ncbi:MAG: hypothetical protein AAGP08_06325 [Pseudomonadota bacterium]
MGAWQHIRRLWAREDGNSTIELVIWFPFLMAILGSAIEASFITTRQAMLSSGIDRVMREYQLGNLGAPTNNELKRQICNATGVIPDCMDALHIEMERIDTDTFSFREGQVQCIDRDEDTEPAVNYTLGNQNDLMLMTVCAAVYPMIPVTGLGLSLPKINGGGAYAIVSYAAFVVEPS